MKIDFISNIGELNFKKLIYRPYRNNTINFGLEDEYFITNKFKQIKICYSKQREFTKTLINSQIIVVDHPTTTLHTGLALNIPTIGFWNKNHWPLTEEANMIFNKLYDVGILHVNGKEAGKFLNN